MCRFTRIFWKVFFDNILPKNGVLVKEFVLQYFAMFGFLTSPITIRCATNILISLAFKSGHLPSHECNFNGLPAWENNIQSLVCRYFFFQFPPIWCPISQYETPKWSSGDVTAFLCTDASFGKQQTGDLFYKLFSSTKKTTCKFIYTLNLLLYIYIYLHINAYKY